QAVMAHPDRIRIGERHTQLAADRAMVLADHAQLAPHVLRRLQNAGQDEASDVIFKSGVEHDGGSGCGVHGSGDTTNYRRYFTFGSTRRVFQILRRSIKYSVIRRTLYA